MKAIIESLDSKNGYIVTAETGESFTFGTLEEANIKRGELENEK